ncbi:MAG: AMP-dependent synthetase [Candidatus Poribacteria bacterium]|nr:MAG: AMP-dependent synthetase [Candidatus Poribacteria bacterium]
MNEFRPTTLVTALHQTVSRHPHKEFIRFHDGSGYASVTFQEFADRVERLASVFIARGLEPGDRVAILGENRLEWAIADYAAMSAGLISVPIYPTLPANQARYILNDSQARGIVLSSRTQAEKVAEIRQDCPSLELLVTMDTDAAPLLDGAEALEVLLNRPEATDATARNELLARRDRVSPEDTVTFIYTSGTTGNPKGVILTHDNFISNIQGTLEVLDIGAGDTLLSFLPLSHVFERMVDFLAMYVGATIVYSRGLRYLADELREVAPTVMACVPRFYESLQARVLKSAEEAPALRRRLFYWAMKQGDKAGRRLREGRRVGPLLSLERSLADRLVLHRLREAVGGRLRFFISGGAPLAVSTAEFFHAAGILILEGYGLTETSPVIAVNRPDHFKFGTVGPPIPGVEVKIADDGEILTRGRHVMKGYYRLPEETKRAIDPDGWFHTGDLGELDEDGFLKITGRKKNLFKLSNGKYVAPEPIENALKASPYIAEAVVIGESQKAAGAIIVPSFPALEEFAQREGIPIQPRSEMVRHPLVQKLYRQEIARLTRDFADYERIRVFSRDRSGVFDRVGRADPYAQSETSRGTGVHA